MKKIIFILMVGSLFADTIVVKTTGKDKDGFIKYYNSENMGEYVGILDAKAYLQVSSGKLAEFNCDDVISIFDDDRKPIPWDCDESSFVPKTLNELDIKKIQKYPVAGGILIAIGGGLLFSTSGSDCDDCDTIEKANEFADGVKSSSQAGYLLITLGGILVALGI